MKSFIKNPSLWTVLILGSTLTFSCTYKKEREQLQAKTAELEQMLHERDSSFNSLMSVMTAVENQIEQIKEQENIISTKSKDFTLGASDQMVMDLVTINNLISNTNVMVRDLSKKLDQSDMELNAFRKKINRISEDLKEREASLSVLRAELIAKNQKIELLDTEVKNLVTEVQLRDTTIKIQKEEIEENEFELNQAFFTVATEKKLRENGLISKEGGFLWIGRSVELQADAIKGNFTPVNINTTRKFFIDSEKAEVITEHPSDSYKLVNENNKINYLEVTNPSEFWKISKYLVISTKS